MLLKSRAALKEEGGTKLSPLAISFTSSSLEWRARGDPHVPMI